MCGFWHPASGLECVTDCDEKKTCGEMSRAE